MIKKKKKKNEGGGGGIGAAVISARIRGNRKILIEKIILIARLSSEGESSRFSHGRSTKEVYDSIHLAVILFEFSRYRL